MAGRQVDLWVQAAAERAIDFSKMRYQDRRWMRHVDLITDYLDRKNYREKLVRDWQEQIATLNNGFMTEKTRINCRQIIADLNLKLFKTYYPSPDSKDDELATLQNAKDVLAQGTDQWEKTFGSLEDPKVQSDINKVAQGLDSLRMKTAEGGSIMSQARTNATRK